jgi:hypothetical protein
MDLFESALTLENARAELLKEERTLNAILDERRFTNLRGQERSHLMVVASLLTEYHDGDRDTALHRWIRYSEDRKLIRADAAARRSWRRTFL